MNVVCLQFFVAESHRHHGKPVYEWLLDRAQSLGAHGGTAIRALAGFGRHGRRDAGFFELAGEQPVVVEFFLEPGLAEALLREAKAAGLDLAWARMAAELGTTG